MQYCPFLQPSLSEVSLIFKVISCISVANLPAVKDDSHSLNSIIFGQKVNGFLASFKLNFNPTNQFYVGATTEKRRAFRAVYGIQDIVYSVQKEGKILEINSI
jgi:hypothetical protein